MSRTAVSLCWLAVKVLVYLVFAMQSAEIVVVAYQQF